MSNYIHLKNRELIFINGDDYLIFLQGLITNDVNKSSKDKAIYSLMLNPQGRFLYEFFLIKYQNGLILEVDKNHCDSLIKKLSFYKLRSKVEIKRLENLSVFFIDEVNEKAIPQDFSDNNFCVFADPRKENFGLRCYANKENFTKIAKNNNLTEENLNFYHNYRLNNKIIDENDLIFDKSIIVEYGFDNLNVIDYKKGCYVGQEIVARAHYKSTIRKKIFLIEIENLSKIEKETEITCLGKKQGVILSSLFYQGKLKALALIKNVDFDDNEIDLSELDLRANEQKIDILK